MNKRHYEHTLPNIRGSLSNTYDENRYIRSLNYNGKNYTKNYLNHFDLLKGGRLLFNMDNKPNMGRGVNESDYPYSFSRD